MFDAAIARNFFLVGSGMEEAQVKGLRIFCRISREIELALMYFGIILVRVVATQPTDIDTVIDLMPFIDGQEDKTLPDTPGVGECSH